jgi:SAM-dependent methyltransferase
MAITHQQVAPVDWHDETLRYDRPHARLVAMARLLRSLPQRRVLDIGCSTAALRTLLPPDCDYYGCDFTPHARAVLAADHFCQLDFNRSCDLSAFAGRGIDAIHIGGVLEYLLRPAELLRSARTLVAAGSPLLVSIINFEAAAFARREAHHLGWIYKPRLEELRQALAEHGWSVHRQIPFRGKRAVREWLFRRRAEARGVDHPWTRRHARQFILLARAR